VSKEYFNFVIVSVFFIAKSAESLGCENFLVSFFAKVSVLKSTILDCEK